MKMNFRNLNLLLGWTVFLIALTVYLLSVEPTASYWDCGEFVATASKLEVGHPPGAPFFMLLGRFFTLFAGQDSTKMALTMNILSATASAFTILFLFWTLTHLCAKLMDAERLESSYGQITVLGSALVGSLAYTFSDSFWFSAVEAEVYSSSSLFTAVVFWAMLQWEKVAKEKGSNRWIILIAYLMGLSIGVHLLNLLAIPALVLIWYFRKYNVTAWRILSSLIVSACILGCMMYVLIPGLTYLATRFELLFVNGMGLPFNSGTLAYLFLLFSTLIFGIYYSHARRKTLLNSLILCMFVIVLGYSSYAVILIRSSANTPLDESNPDTVFSLLSYLNREQYEASPLLYGPYFNFFPVDYKSRNVTYYRGDRDYYQVPKNGKYLYKDGAKGFFPRMWSLKPEHAPEYMYWGNLKESELYALKRDENGQVVYDQTGKPVYDRNLVAARPRFGQNLNYFFRYQIGYMYLRYFMWNFAGRQNDIQGRGELNKGNWISGIGFIDDIRLGPQEQLPGYLKNNKGRNRYYCLPLLAGLLGAWFQYRRHRHGFWIISSLFLLTGLAIVVYLNQYPLQPRERDYAYVGSFYAFSIWIGMGTTAAILSLSRGKIPLLKAVLILTFFMLAIPFHMARVNWDDHDRSHRRTTPAFARNLLNSCRPDAILFTAGDNDTFPLWYLQEVEGVRTDVRVAHLSYLTADWYIEQMKHTFYDSQALPVSMEKEHYISGSRDRVYLTEKSGALIQEKYDLNKERYQADLLQILKALLAILKKADLDIHHPKDYKAVECLGDRMNPLLLYRYVKTFKSTERSDGITPYREEISALSGRLEQLIRKIDADFAPLKEAFDYLLADDPRFKQGSYFIPATKFEVPADSAIQNRNMVPEKFQDMQTSSLRFSPSEHSLNKNLLTVLDIIANNNWERPIYFSSTIPSRYYLNLEESFIREGFALRIAPIKGSPGNFLGEVDTKDMYKKLMEEFDWGGIDMPGVYLDENNLRMMIHYRYAFAILAQALSEEGNYTDARNVLDHCMEKMPGDTVPYGPGINTIIHSYLMAGDRDTAIRVSDQYQRQLIEELGYYQHLARAKKRRSARSASDMLASLREINSLRIMCQRYGEADRAQKLEEQLRDFGPSYNDMLE